jgi:hypothetical protein
MALAGLPCRHASRTARAAWVALLVLAVLLRAAVPGLAAAAAQARGVAVADICSVYGVRTLPANADPSPDTGPHAGQHLGCLLAPLLGAAPLPALPPTLAAAEPTASPPRAAKLPTASPHDAARRWLTLRLHAPPARA